MVDAQGQLQPTANQEQQQMSQSHIPVIKRADSQASHGSHQSYGSHLRKGSTAKAKDPPKDDDMNHQ
jgi:hypothetical protein